MTRNFGMNVRADLSGDKRPPARFGTNSTHADLYLFPPQSILHREDIPHSPLNVGALWFVGLSVLSSTIMFIGLYYLALHIFGVH